VKRSSAEGNLGNDLDLAASVLYDLAYFLNIFLCSDKGSCATILIDDGLIEMTVEEIRGEEIVCRVINGGFVSNHKGVNVPGAILSMPLYQ